MNDVLSALQQCMVFRDIPAERLEREILPQGKLREIPKDTFLYLYQEQVDYFGVVISGRINTQHIFSDGSYNIVETIGPSEILGVDLIWTKSRIAPYHAVAAAEARVLFFPAELVTEPGLLPEDCRQMIMRKMLTLISHDNIRKDYRLAILSRKGLRERIMTYLTMQANKRRSAEFTIPFSREELASYLCVNRSALSHELSLLQQEHIISFRKNRFTVHHPDAKES